MEQNLIIGILLFCISPFLGNHIVDFTIGVIGSLIASYFFLFYIKQKEKKANKIKFGGSEGIYIGYGPTNENEDFIDNKPLSDVMIKYEKDNILSIKLVLLDFLWVKQNFVVN